VTTRVPIMAPVNRRILGRIFVILGCSGADQKVQGTTGISCLPTLGEARINQPSVRNRLQRINPCRFIDYVRQD
jgi:hypothetical protein